MTKISSLTQLLRDSGGQLRFFDMGRRVSKISPELFEKVENQTTPYPLPYLHHAWLAVMLWNPKNKAQGVVWFLKLPLDEQGFLVQAVRDDLINRLLQNAGNLLQSEGSEQPPEDALKDNPFSFKPDQEKMAIFHACSTLATHAPASQYYEHAQHYFSGQIGYENWHSLGHQGIADLVIRADKDNNSRAMTDSIPHLPNAPYELLCTCLEHIEPDHRLFSALEKRILNDLKDPSCTSNTIAAEVRAISNAKNTPEKEALLTAILESDHALEAEVIAAIATRCNENLQQPKLLKLFLEQLAAGKAGQAGFSRILSDLMFMPALRALILIQFRDDNRSEALTAAIGSMFGNQFSH